jgi:hypothetical protein
MTKDEDRQERLNQVYRYLYAYRGIDSQIAFAKALRVQRSALSAAMNGNKAYLTNNLFTKICVAFPGVFNLDYLLTGKGSLLVEETAHNDAFFRSMEAIDPSSFINAIIAAKDETIAAIREQLETKDELILSLRQQLESLRQQLETTRHHSGSGIEQSIPMVADELQKTKK